MKKNESEKEKKPHNRIAELRKDRGLTIQQVADGIGVSNGTISRYEKGTREPKLETWVKLADFFGVSVSYLQGMEQKDLEGLLKRFSNDVIILAEFIGENKSKSLSAKKIVDISLNSKMFFYLYDETDIKKIVNIISTIQNDNYLIKKNSESNLNNKEFAKENLKSGLDYCEKKTLNYYEHTLSYLSRDSSLPKSFISTYQDMAKMHSIYQKGEEDLYLLNVAMDQLHTNINEMRQILLMNKKTDSKVANTILETYSEAIREFIKLSHKIKNNLH